MLLPDGATSDPNWDPTIRVDDTTGRTWCEWPDGRDGTTVHAVMVHPAVLNGLCDVLTCLKEIVRELAERAGLSEDEMAGLRFKIGPF